jgi:nitroimidazol reductase NimA-like FMN-containing flavoprotein (pyridoxamine 5'-phosphate oxidase superfamily)
VPQARTVEMSRTECLRLLQYESFIGRVAFAMNGVVHLRPVNYLADERGLVFCTTRGTVLAAVSSGTSVVFEVDASQSMDHSGWSVILRGTAGKITDSDELDLLRRGPLKSWAVSPGEHWVRVDIEEISGVRIPVR